MEYNIKSHICTRVLIGLRLNRFRKELRKYAYADSCVLGAWWPCTAVCLSLGPPPMKSSSNRFKSRRKTPWDLLPCRSPSEDFIRNGTMLRYSQRHPQISSSYEISLMNSCQPHSCRYCGSDDFKKDGHSVNGVQVYRCNSCHRKFTVLAGTIFDSHKISITEWIEYWRNLLAYLSLTADSWNNKNAFTTAKLWFKKTCLLLQNIQDSIVLSGKVFCDETYLPVRNEDIIRKDNNQKLRGHSRNQMCIETITDGKIGRAHV